MTGPLALLALALLAVAVVFGLGAAFEGVRWSVALAFAAPVAFAVLAGVVVATGYGEHRP